MAAQQDYGVSPVVLLPVFGVVAIGFMLGAHFQPINMLKALFVLEIAVGGVYFILSGFGLLNVLSGSYFAFMAIYLIPIDVILGMYNIYLVW